MAEPSAAIASALDPAALYPFDLDNFQLQAIAAIDAGKSVVVCVPTGSGKTLVGEYAIHRALARGKRVFYTTPLKALSNQKLRDFRERFGTEIVGLLTGDTSINREAPVVVMTTEVFRNMLYGTAIGQVGVSLEDVEAVVLDECHYMNDPSRGTVWEESIVYCPAPVQILALSATVANSGQLCDWIDRVHGPTDLVRSDHRPVPLKFYFSDRKGLFPLLNKDNTKIDSRLRAAKRGKDKNKRVKTEETPSIAQVLAQLQAKDLLPAIYFIFSRRGCDRAVEDLSGRGVSLVTPAERQTLQSRLERFLAECPEGGRSGQIEPLTRGIAAHHAGVLPAWKALVEELFGEGLVKVVFATETLAAGINMPARTTVISSVSKRTDRGHRMLRASEFLQMAGRAGRRGMDLMGHVVCVQTRFEGAEEAAFLATREADPLVSQFTPTYGMALNLLQTHTLSEAKTLLEKSFAQYLASLKQIPEQQRVAELTAELARLDVELAPIPIAEFERFAKLKARIKEEKRIAKYLQQQAWETSSPFWAAAVATAEIGQIFYVRGKKDRRAANAIPVALYRIFPDRAFAGLGADNRWYALGTDDIIGFEEGATAPIGPLEALELPANFLANPGQRCDGDEASAVVAGALGDRAAGLQDPPEVLAQLAKVERSETELANLSLSRQSNPTKLLKRHQKRQALRQELGDRQSKSREHQSQHWQEFLNIVAVLREFGALDGAVPTSIGQTAAALRADNELWLGLALGSGYFDDIEPQALAAICCALVSEPPRPDSWTNYGPSAATLEALKAIKPLRRELFQVQRQHKVAMPVWLEADLVGTVEQWVLGADWNELCENTSQDEGDIVRVLRRTMDILSQIPHVPFIAESLIAAAQQALRAMRRFPVED